MSSKKRRHEKPKQVILTVFSIKTWTARAYHTNSIGLMMLVRTKATWLPGEDSILLKVQTTNAELSLDFSLPFLDPEIHDATSKGGNSHN